MRRWTILVALLCYCASSTNICLAGKQQGTLDIYFIDVEGGAATLIVTPTDESILIDSGYPDFNGRDRDRILHTIREEAKLDHLDHAVVSHWHLDHYGNHASLAAMIPIRQFWDRGIPDALQEDKSFEQRIADYRAASQNNSKTLKTGDVFELETNGAPLKITIVTASRDVIANTGEPNPFANEHQPKDRDNSDNASSLGLLVEFGQFRFLCCGDLTWNVEAKLMMPNNPLGKIDLFMVTHHGLPVSNNPVFVKAIDPVVAVMCNGPKKGGHPATLATLRACPSLQHIYQLHRNVTLGDDEQTPPEFIANSEPTANCEGIGVKATVAADGTSYTVQIGQAGTRNEYKSRSITN